VTDHALEVLMKILDAWEAANRAQGQDEIAAAHEQLATALDGAVAAAYGEEA
jgi:hypothetical protein